MPCPLFLPETNPLAAFSGFHTGRCAADPGLAIGDETLRLCCNRGYARTKCERAARSEADATSFMVKAIGAGGIEVAWALERNHHPVEVGRFTIQENKMDEKNPLMRQARAYAAGAPGFTEPDRPLRP